MNLSVASKALHIYNIFLKKLKFWGKQRLLCAVSKPAHVFAWDFLAISLVTYQRRVGLMVGRERDEWPFVQFCCSADGGGGDRGRFMKRACPHQAHNASNRSTTTTKEKGGNRAGFHEASFIFAPLKTVYCWIHLLAT